jgi:rubrerythrin
MILGFNAYEIFRIAIQIEENGRLFYKKAGQAINNNDIKTIFSFLEGEELNHKNRFIELKSRLPDKASEKVAWDPDNETDTYLKMMADMHIFRTDADVEEKLKNIKNYRDAIRLAISFEKDSILFYISMKDFTEENKGKEFIDELIYAEKEHLKKLSRIYGELTECHK